MTTDTVTEWCSNCEHEVELKREFKKQKCPNCKEEILPCAQCITQNCANCPLTTFTAYRVIFDFGNFEVTAMQKTFEPIDADDVSAIVQDRLNKIGVNLPFHESIVTVKPAPEWLED